MGFQIHLVRMEDFLEYTWRRCEFPCRNDRYCKLFADSRTAAGTILAFLLEVLGPMLCVKSQLLKL